MSELLNIYTMNEIKLNNRVVMAPMTRSRAFDLVPTNSMVTYYRQRATAGLIVSEGSPVSMEGRGQAYTPGIYTDEQIEGWRKVTEAVHAQGGKIFIQLWHVGRSSHIAHQPDGQAPVSSVSRVAEGCTTHIPGDHCESVRVFHSQPRALATDEVPRVTQDFVRRLKMLSGRVLTGWRSTQLTATSSSNLSMVDLTTEQIVMAVILPIACGLRWKLWMPSLQPLGVI